MRVLVLYAHPVETSFHAVLHARAVEELSRAGHEVDDCDLYAEDFDPRLSREERLAYHDSEVNQSNVASYVARLKNAEALVLCFPVWSFGYPAILKGFFDRVFLPGVSFTMENGKAAPCLHNITKVAAVTTYGASRFKAMLVGDPPRKAIKRALRVAVKPMAPMHYLAHYDMNRSSNESRSVFLEKVGREMARF